MISYCTAISKYEATDLLHGYERKGRPPVDGYGYVAWIGIEPAESPLRRFPQERQLLLRFDDVTHESDNPLAETPQIVNGGLVEWFDREHAEQIIAFTRELHEDHRPWALLIHCTAGISRSTATALWVREHYKGVKEHHSEFGWRPNKTVARVLREVAR